MSQQADELRDATDHINDWNDARIERELHRFKTNTLSLGDQPKARPLRSKVAWLLVPLATAGAFSVYLTTQHSEQPSRTLAAQVDQRVLKLPDGSVASLMGKNSKLSLVSVEAETVRLRLTKGKARFSVAPNPKRTFSVEVGAVTVSVLGTEFELEHAAEQVHVVVLSGRVSVASHGNTVVLAKGGSGWFPLKAPTEEQLSMAEGSAGAPPETDAAEVDLPGAEPGKAEPLAARAATPNNRPLTAGELIARADQARGEGDAARAAKYYKRVLKNYPGDSRVGMAAFMLGRLQLASLGQPAAAARSFRRVQKLRGGSPLAHDALAREIEALSRSGNKALARERAKAYELRYPGGRWLEAVKRHAAE